MTQPAPAAFELEQNIPIAENPSEVNREATRWPWFPGDIITPAAKRVRPDLRLGGEYLGQEYKTLVRSKGLLRRCQLTPMEIGFDFLNDDLIGGEEGLVLSVVKDNGEGAVLAKNLNAVRVFPGDEIKSLLRGRHNDTTKGEVEISPLQGQTFEDVQKAGLQDFIFPNWKKVMAGVEILPVQLSWLQKHLESRRADTSDESIRQIFDEMLESCESYRLWGLNYLKTATQLVRAPVANGFVHTYSPQAEMLFEQLEVRREDLIRPEQDIADIVAKVQGGSAVTNDDMKALLEKMTEAFTLLAAQKNGEPPATEVVPNNQVDEKSKTSKK